MINLATKYSDIIAKKYQIETFLMGKMQGVYSFDGFKTVTIYTPVTTPLNDYTRSGIARFGTPTDVADEIQTLTLTKDRSFSKIIDKANNSDQMKIKKSGEIMQLQIKEQVGPEIDKRAIKVFAENAGLVTLNVAPVAATIVTLLATDLAKMDDAGVPQEGRFIYLSSSYYNILRLSSEVLAIDPIAARAIGKGSVAEFMGATIVKVPSTYFPTNVWYIIVHNGAGAVPIKLETLRILTEVAGIDGAVLEYHCIYDAYVIGTKSNGILVNAATALQVGATTITATGASHAITNATGSAVIYYTLDGSDPRSSASRVLYSAAVVLTSGQTIKAVGTKADMITGAVASATYTA